MITGSDRRLYDVQCSFHLNRKSPRERRCLLRRFPSCRLIATASWPAGFSNLSLEMFSHRLRSTSLPHGNFTLLFPVGTALFSKTLSFKTVVGSRDHDTSRGHPKCYRVNSHTFHMCIALVPGCLHCLVGSFSDTGPASIIMECAQYVCRSIHSWPRLRQLSGTEHM